MDLEIVENKVKLEVTQNRVDLRINNVVASSGPTFENVQEVNSSNVVMTNGDINNLQDKDARLIWDADNNTHVLQVYNLPMASWEDSDLRVDDLVSGPASIHISDAFSMNAGGDIIGVRNLFRNESTVFPDQRLGAHTEVSNETAEERPYGNNYGLYTPSDSGAIPQGTGIDFITQFTSPLTFVTFKIEFYLMENLTNEEIVYNAYFGTDSTGENIVRQRQTITGLIGDKITFDFENDMYVTTGDETYTEVTKRDGTPLQVEISDLGAPYVNAFIRTYERKGLAYLEEAEQVKVSSNDTTAGYLEDKITTSGALVKSISNEGGDERLNLDTYLNVSTGDYLDIDGNFILNANQFIVGTIIGQRTKITHIGVALHSNDLAGGATATLRVALTSVDSSGLSTLIEEGSLAINDATPDRGFINVPLNAEAELGDLGLNYQLSAGYNNLSGGGSLKLYKINLNSVNDFRIAGQTSFSGAYPSTFTSTNQNTQALLVAYHNTDTINMTLPSDPEPNFNYDECQYTQTGSQTFSATGKFINWSTFSDSRLNLAHSDFTLGSNVVTVNHDGIYNITGSIRYSSTSQRMQAVVKVYINDIDLGLLFTDSYIRNSGSASNYWNNSFGGFDILLTKYDTIKIWIEQERRDTSDLTGTLEANQGLLRIERKQ